MTRINPRTFLLPFGLFWSVFVCGFIGIVCHDAFCQLRVMSFASTEGVVDSSDLQVPPWGTHSGGSYDAKIAYHYLVGNRQYGGNRVRYLALRSQGWAADMVRRFTVGTHPRIFYDPDNPAEAVLVRGIQGDDLMMALFLTPFTMIMLAIWLFVLAPRWTRFVGFRILEEGMITRIRPSPGHAVVGAVAGLGIGMFAVCSIVGLSTGFHLSLPVAVMAWGAASMIGIAVVMVKVAAVRSGSQDIVLDLVSKTLKPPERKAILFKDISHLRLKQPYSYGNCKLWIGFGRGSQRMNLPSGFGDESEVRHLAEWIAKVIGVSLNVMA